MKKITILIISLILIGVLSACTTNVEKKPKESKSRVVLEEGKTETEQILFDQTALKKIEDYNPSDYVEIPDLSGRSVDVAMPKFMDEDSVKMKAAEKKGFIYKPDNYALRNGDMFHLTFMGLIDGEEFPGGSGQNVYCVEGQADICKEFDDAVLGLKKGEVTYVPGTGLKIKGLEDIDLNKAVFQVSIQDIFEYPELTDSEIQDMKKEMEKATTEPLETKKEEQIMKMMEDIVVFKEIPEDLIQERKDWYLATLSSNPSGKEENEITEEHRDQAGAYAENAAKSELFFRACAEKLGIKENDDKYNSAKELVLKRNNLTETEALEKLGSSSFKTGVLRQAVMQELKDIIKINYINYTLSD